jgi:quinohemoprotein ethanol dehydrogenase
MWSVDTAGLVGGGVMTTGGNLVFQGQLDGKFNAYAADSGKLLWSFQAQAPVLAAPATFSVNGRQYVSVLSGISGTAGLLGKEMSGFSVDYRTQARRLLTFAIGGQKKLPAAERARLEPADDPTYKADPDLAARGTRIYGQRCIACHGIGVIAAGAAPDLRTSGIPLSAEAFESVVRNGALLPNGMPRYPEFSDEDLAAIRQYIRSQAHEWREARKGGEASAALP